MGIKKVVSLPLSIISIAIFCVLLSTQHCVATTTDEKDESLIIKTCKQTEFPDVCSSTFESDPRSLKASDVRGLSRIGLELVFTEGKEAVKVALDMLNKATDYPSWDRIGVCMIYLNISIYDVKYKGLPSFDAMKYKNTYEILESALSTAKDDCNTFVFPEFSKWSTMIMSFLTDLKTIVHLLF